MPVTSRMIHDNWVITIPFHQRCGEDVKSTEIVWDPARTIITKADLNVRVFSDWDQTYADYFINNVKVVEAVWTGFQGNQWREATVNVTAYLSNGRNLFKAISCKNWTFPWSVRHSFTSTLILTFSGDAPGIGLPEPPPDGAWTQYIPWVVAGLFGVGLIIIASKRTKPFVTIERKK